MHMRGAGDRLRDLFESPAAGPGRTEGGVRLGCVDQVGIDYAQLGLAQTEVVERTGPVAAEQDVRAGEQVDEALFPVGTLDVGQDGFLAPAHTQQSDPQRRWSGQPPAPLPAADTSRCPAHAFWWSPVDRC